MSQSKILQLYGDLATEFKATDILQFVPLKATTRYEPRHEKTDFLICKNKGANQLRGDREADQRLCFRYTKSTIPLLTKCEISSI